MNHIVWQSNHRPPSVIVYTKRTPIDQILQEYLFKWIDRILPYNLNIDHMPGSKFGSVDFISWNPFAKAKKFDENFVVVTSLSKF